MFFFLIKNKYLYIKHGQFLKYYQISNHNETIKIIQRFTLFLGKYKLKYLYIHINKKYKIELIKKNELNSLHIF